MGSKRIGQITEKIYTYPPEISDADIDAGNVEDDGSDMILVDPSEYTVQKRNILFKVIGSVFLSVFTTFINRNNL